MRTRPRWTRLFLLWSLAPIIQATAFVGCMPANDSAPECYVSAQWEYDLLCPNSIEGNTSLRVHIVDWPDDEILLAAKHIDGASRQLLSIEVEKPRINVEGFDSVVGRASESAELRNVWGSLVSAPNVIVYPPDSTSDLAPSETCGELKMLVVNTDGVRQLSVRGHEPVPCGFVLTGWETTSWSWADIDIHIEEGVRPNGFVRIDNPMSASLSHLQELGTMPTIIRLVDIGDSLFQEYSSWLASAGFTGLLERCPATVQSHDECPVVDFSSEIAGGE